MANSSRTKKFRSVIIGLLLSLMLLGAGLRVSNAWAQSQMMQNFQELFERSQKEKKGLTFYVHGQTIAGVVAKIIGTEAVEIRNQTFSRIIIRLDRIDALAIN